MKEVLKPGLNPVGIESQGGLLRGSFHLPEGAGPFPATVLCHGFTGTRCEPHRLFVKMSRLLEHAGIASLRFDFYGSGESDGDHEDMTVSGEVVDALAAVRFVARLPQVDRRRIAILGLSLGGLVAALCAERYRAFRGVCLWAPVAHAHALWSSRLTSAARKSLARRGWIDSGGDKVGRGFVRELASLDPVGALSAADVPVLVLHGSQDTVVPPDHGMAYHDACPGSKYVEVPKADHTFNSVAAEKRVLEKSLEWLKERLLGQNRSASDAERTAAGGKRRSGKTRR